MHATFCFSVYPLVLPVLSVTAVVTLVCTASVLLLSCVPRSRRHWVRQTSCTFEVTPGFWVSLVSGTSQPPGAPFLPSGPYTAAELDEFVAATARQVWGPNSTLVPFSSVPGRNGKAGEKPKSFNDRLKKCLQMACGQKQPLVRQAASGPAFGALPFLHLLQPKRRSL